MISSPTVLDLFCGCGGISKGFELAGFSIIGGIDFNDDATKSFKINFPDATVKCGDITEISNEEVKTLYGGVDIIVGGPPCQGFSSANRWQKEMEDPRNKLFFQYLRFVEVLRPKAILIENVRGLLTRDNGYAKNRIEELLTSMGYVVANSILDSSNFGVPQIRKRAFFVAFRSDLNKQAFDFSSIPYLPRVTVEDAIGELYALENGDTTHIPTRPNNEYTEYLRKGMDVLNDHTSTYPAEIVQKRISFVPQGGNWQDVPSELWPSQRSNRHSSAYKRLSPGQPSCTIDTGNAHSNYFHPIFNRIPSIRESARLQSFPDSFAFYGSRGSRYKQVGNAVPPLLAKAVASQILIKLNENN